MKKKRKINYFLRFLATSTEQTYIYKKVKQNNSKLSSIILLRSFSEFPHIYYNFILMQILPNLYFVITAELAREQQRMKR